MFTEVQRARLAIEKTQVPCILPAYTLAGLITTTWTARLHTGHDPKFEIALYETVVPRRCMFALVVGALIGDDRVRMCNGQLGGLRFPDSAGQYLIDVLTEHHVPDDVVIRARYAIHGT